MYKSDTTIGFYREKAELSQQKLSEIINVPRTTMSFYETKREYPSIEVAEKIAEILKVPIGKLYSEEELDLMKYRGI